jgi:hypothetical protein
MTTTKRGLGNVFVKRCNPQIYPLLDLSPCNKSENTNVLVAKKVSAVVLLEAFLGTSVDIFCQILETEVKQYFQLQGI